MFRLKIINEPRGSLPFLVVGTQSNRQVQFDWDDKVYAYCYTPKDDADALDVVSVNWLNIRFPWRFAPFSGPANAGGPSGDQNAPKAVLGPIPAYVLPELYADYPLQDLLMLAANDGPQLEGNCEDRNNVLRQLHRYYEGRGWRQEEAKRANERIAELEKELTQRKANEGVQLNPPIVPAPKPKLTPAERMAKARAARKPRQPAAA